MHPSQPIRLRVITTPLGRFVDVDLGGDDDPDPAAAAADNVDAGVVVLDDAGPGTSEARPQFRDRLRALTARLRPAVDPRRQELLAAIAETRAQQREAVEAAFAAWEETLPRLEERGRSSPDASSVRPSDAR